MKRLGADEFEFLDRGKGFRVVNGEGVCVDAGEIDRIRAGDEIGDGGLGQIAAGVTELKAVFARATRVHAVFYKVRVDDVVSCAAHQDGGLEAAVQIIVACPAVEQVSSRIASL